MLTSVSTNLGGTGDKPVASKLDGWQQHVRRFYDESTLPRDKWTDLTWHRHDWVGAMYLRDVVPRTIDDHSRAFPEAVTRWLGLVDDFMRSFTEEVVDWAPDEDRSDGWWWSRLPIAGPVCAGWWADE